jgi:Ca-activated chloride channel family protein
MIFVQPIFLLLFLAIPLMLVFVLRRERMRKAATRRLGNIALLLSPEHNFNANYRIWKLALWAVTIAALIVALARPVWGENVSIVETQGASVMVVLDVSKSMNAQDITPSRLGRAKLAVLDLLEGLAGHEVGLILFAGSAFVQFPLTTDTLSAGTFVGAASSDSITRQGTNTDAALRLAVNSFNYALSSHRYIVLLTDGENHEGDPSGAAGRAAEQGITIFSIGYGSPDGAPIPIRDENGNEAGYQLDDSGNTVTSALDERSLKTISEQTGGTYQRASSTGDEIRNLIQTINVAQSAQLGSRTESQGIERFSIFIALALLALSAEMMLPEVPRKAADA